MKGDSDYVFDIVGRSLPPRAMELIRKLDYVDDVDAVRVEVLAGFAEVMPDVNDDLENRKTVSKAEETETSYSTPVYTKTEENEA